MNKVIGNLLLIATLVTAAGCSDSDRNNQDSTYYSSIDKEVTTKQSQGKDSTPDEILHAYLNAGLAAGASGKSKETYSLLSIEDKKATTEEEYLSESTSSVPDISPVIMAAFMKNISYVIMNSATEDGVANLEVEATMPVIKHYLSGINIEKINLELENKLLSYLNSQDLKFEKDVSSYKLLREPEGWRVFLDLSTKKKIKMLLEEAEELAPNTWLLINNDAAQLESMKTSLLAAKDKYEEVLSFGENTLANYYLEKLEILLNKLDNYERYKSKIQIKNIRIGKGTFGETGVFGEVKNNSDVVINRIGITIYFLDKEGNPIHEKSYNPVYITESSYVSQGIPLKPNYSRKFGLKADDAPSEWSKKVEVVLSDLEVEMAAKK